VTKARIDANRASNWSHGLRSDFAESGDTSALTQPQRSRLAELRAELATPDGVLEALRERAARMVLLCEWGEAWLQQRAEEAGPVAAFEAKMLQRFVSVAESARRSLEALIRLRGKADGGPGAAEVLRVTKDGSGEQG
jgi:hypothetical protein